MPTLTVRADAQGTAISPLLHGVFFEDINFAGDGGLCPQLVNNGSFEFTPDSLLGWRKVERGGASGFLSVLDQNPLNENNPHYLRLTIDDPKDGFGMVNEGFHGMGVRRGKKYIFCAHARSNDTVQMRLQIELLGRNNQPIGIGNIQGFSGSWQKYSCVIECCEDEEKAKLLLLSTGSGLLDLDAISLVPEDSPLFRADLLQLLKDLKPKFFRFPGGCIVEGRLLGNRYQWKKTIGDPSQRTVIVNRWNTEFKHRLAPDYFQSFGLGFHEYFLLCEELGAQPLPIINCGMACQFNSGELVPLDQLEPFIDDALDLIEFANGPVESAWGNRRAELGHPAPFNLKFIGIGNEQWGPHYIERYARFAEAFKNRYPEIQLIAAAGHSPDGAEFEFAWRKLRELNADIIDEHYYRSPDWFIASANRYDKYDRSGPKVFAGEFAAQSAGVVNPQNRNNWNCALAEAAFMTGLERNGDVVTMACYAPLFAHVEGWQWTPNLIWFDNLRSFGTPSYYVQKLFAQNSGDVACPIEVEGDTSGLFTCAARQHKSGDVILKLVNVEPKPMRVKIRWIGMTFPARGESYLLAAALDAENSLESPLHVSPFLSVVRQLEAESDYFLPPFSLTVLRIHQ